MKGTEFDSAHSSHQALPAVSIIVPTHNRPELLSRLLESLRHLTYPKERLELIVVGGAQDLGQTIVRAAVSLTPYPVRYGIVPDHSLKSASFKRNEGARSAAGEILAFTDDDCVVHPDWITRAVEMFGQGVGAVEGAVSIPKPKVLTPTYRGSLRLSLPGGYQTCNILYRKAVIEECGGFDLAFPYYLEDTDLAFTVMERGYTIRYAPNAVVEHPVQAGRPLKAFAIARTVEQMPYLFSKHRKSKNRLRESVKPLTRSHYVYLALYAVILALSLQSPLVAVITLGIGLGVLVPLHLAYDHWGLHIAPQELVLLALCQPIVPALRLAYWIKGSLRLRLESRGE